MTLRLEEEIRQGRPFESLGQAAHISIARTAALLEHAVAEALRPHGITLTQFNVLRILRGAGPSGLCRREVGERMITPVPDATRLLDRMEAAGLIGRERGAEDRRFVTTRISESGLRLVDLLDEPIRELHERHFGELDEAELRGLIDVLARVREAMRGAASV
jgi:DNA-binding MarR family transcriptional regulator